MARKSRRDRRRQPRLSPAQMVQPGSGPLADEPEPSASGAAPDLGTEYAYVLRDLRRIGIIAAAMLVVLIGLAIGLP